jgi:UDP-N-acetylmuramoylalanine--D-glutamate ligase
LNPPAGSEIAVIGLGASGRAVAALLARDGRAVYASDSGTGDDLQAAARELSAAGVVVDLGRHDLARIARAAQVVVSPGVPPTSVAVEAAAAAGVPVISEIEVALAHLPGLRYIVVTGTNGKTTTTALIGHLLRGLGSDAVDAGNIGLPLSEVALRAKRPQWVALEVSSFQLHDTPSIDPAVGVLTNLSPDHLDRYPSVESYYADKARLFANAGPDSIWVLNGDDPLVQAMADGVPGHHATFSIEGRRADASYSPTAGLLELDGEPLIARRELPLLGDHNVANALAAALAVARADAAHRTPAARARMAAALRSFGALPHRLQSVGEFGRVEWINDSKATNVSSTGVALAGMVRPTIVLLGGRHKGQPYAPLAEPLRRVAKVVLAFGEAAPIIARDLADVVPVEQLGSDFRAVVDRARALAEPGDAVLLSPACSSFDMFHNYLERGTTFARLAAEGR